MHGDIKNTADKKAQRSTRQRPPEVTGNARGIKTGNFSESGIHKHDAEQNHQLEKVEIKPLSYVNK